jgi:hypothetical protein
MRRGALLAVVLVLTGTRSAWAQPSQTPATGFTVQAVADRSALRIGERVVVTLTLAGAGDPATARPSIGPRVGDFDVLSITPVGLARYFGRPVRAWRLVLTTFETGARTPGDLAIEGTTPDGRAFVTPPASPLAMAVTGPDVTADDPLRPLSGALGVPQPAVVAIWLPRGLAAAGVALVVVVVARRLFARAGARWERTRRWRRLHRALDVLERHAPREPHAARTMCHQIVSIIRQGTQFAVGRRLEDLSTPEIVAAVDAEPAGRAVAPELGPVLAGLDRLRFASAKPGGPDIAQSVAGARRVLRAAETATHARERRAS